MSGTKKGIGGASTSTPSGSIKDAFVPRLRSTDSSPLTAQDIRDDKKQEIQSFDDSIDYILHSPYHLGDVHTSLDCLSDTIFLVSRACKGTSSSTSKAITNTLRAVAFILQHLGQLENDKEPSLTTIVNDKVH